ncbi:MAG: hypothetical protein ACLGIB_00120 [Actinomycetota bacterium]
MKHVLAKKMAAGVAVLAILGAACSSEPTTSTANNETAGSSMEDMDSSPSASADLAVQPVDAPAAQLDQTLTQLLGEHEYLAGIAIAMGVQNGADSAEFEAAAAALDANSVDLSKAVASVYGNAGGKQFLELWRTHIGFFVDYTLAGGEGAAAAKAKKNLDGYRSDFGAFIDAATSGTLPKQAVADALKPHVEATLTAIDTVLGKREGNPFIELKKAAHHMPMIANALAGGIADDQGIEGDVTAPSAQLQSALTHGLNEHEYLAGIAVAMGVMKGPDSAEFEAAAAALDENSVDLSKAVASVYGNAGGKQFLELWRTHIGFFVDYTLAGGEGAAAAKAKKNLDGYRSDFGAFIEGATEGELTKADVEGALKPHVEATLAAIDAVLGRSDANPFLELKEAAHHMPMIASALANAIVNQQPETFE